MYTGDINFKFQRSKSNDADFCGTIFDIHYIF